MESFSPESLEELDPLMEPTYEENPPKRRRVTEADSTIKTSSVLEDVFDAIGKNVAHKLRGMPQQQRIIAEKIISDVMYHGQMENLTTNSHMELS